MDSTELATRVCDLRARGLTPKEIARTLGVRRVEVEPLIRAHARSTVSAAEPAVVGCWASPGWSHGLRWDAARGWQDERPRDEDQLPNLVSVLVAREHRYGKVSACGYLVDTRCLGVKNAIGPRILEAHELGEFRQRYFGAYDEAPQQVPIELAREMVLCAEDHARRLGFEPHPDFEACRSTLGAWNGPGAFEFGEPVFVAGPHDDTAAIIRTLERSVGRGNFRCVILR